MLLFSHSVYPSLSFVLENPLILLDTRKTMDAAPSLRYLILNASVECEEFLCDPMEAGIAFS